MKKITNSMVARLDADQAKLATIKRECAQIEDLMITNRRARRINKAVKRRNKVRRG